MTTPDYEENPKKKRSWIKIGIGIAILLGFSACSYTCVGLMGDSLKFQKIATSFIEETAGGKFPAADSGEWSSEIGITQEQVDQLSVTIASFGALKEAGQPSCTISVKADTNTPSGRFADCFTVTKYENAEKETQVLWHMEDDEWKIYGYHTKDLADAINEDKAVEAENEGEE